jgi:hypothetical protein
MMEMGAAHHMTRNAGGPISVPTTIGIMIQAQMLPQMPVFMTA